MSNGKKKAAGKKRAPKSNVPATLEEVGAVTPATDYGEDLGMGFEDVTSDDMIIPFLNILQKGSPQVDQDAPTYIEGAKAGMLMNSVTEEVFSQDDGMLFIPIHRTHKFVEWVPRGDGGGFVGVREPEDPMVMEARKGGAFGTLETPDGNDLKETFYIYGLVVSDQDGSYIPAAISFTSTQIRAYKRWITQMRSIQLVSEDGRRVTPPMFAHVFRLKTRYQENAKGSWYGWLVSFANQADKSKGLSTAAEASRLPASSELYQAARNIRDLLMSDAVKVAYETSDEADSEGDDDTF